MKRVRDFSTMLGWLLTTLGGGPAGAQSFQSSDTLVTTRHQVVVGGRTIRYTATAGRLPLLVNDTGDLMGWMFFVAYVADQPPGSAPRPITFLWNGGPGANASQVHLVGFGPRRIKAGDTYPAWPSSIETELVSNEETWLETSDLVFVDPIGTGYSRATTAAFRDTLYTDWGDAESVAEFIRLYRTRFDAWDAPVFLTGESYGTTRAMAVAGALERRRVRLAGVILISGGFEVGQRVEPALATALQVPMYTAAAHYHGRLPPSLQGLDQHAAIARAVEWARTSYGPALERRHELSPGQRSTLTQDLARFTGIAPRYVDSTTLAISKAVFADRLLQDRGLELGRYDLRMTTPSRNLATTEWLPFRDPSLRPMIDLMQGTSALLIRYLRDTLGYRSDLLYRGPFGEAFHPQPLTVIPPGYASDWMAVMWNHGRLVSRGPSSSRAPARPAAQAERGSGEPPQPPLRQAMDLNPRLQVMNLRGMYDASCAALEDAVARAPEYLRHRITNHCYSGGHMMYSDTEVRRQIQHDVARFVRTALLRPS